MWLAQHMLNSQQEEDTFLLVDTVAVVDMSRAAGTVAVVDMMSLVAHIVWEDKAGHSQGDMAGFVLDYSVSQNFADNCHPDIECSCVFFLLEQRTE
jgi:hypothetical protein